MYWNQVTVIGKLAAVPEFTETTLGRKHVEFSIETRKALPMIGENPMEVFPCMVQGSLAHCFEESQQGDWLLVVGQLYNQPYQATDGIIRFKTKVIATSVRFMPTKEHAEFDAKIEKLPSSLG